MNPNDTQLLKLKSNGILMDKNIYSKDVRSSPTVHLEYDATIWICCYVVSFCDIGDSKVVCPNYADMLDENESDLLSADKS